MFRGEKTQEFSFRYNEFQVSEDLQWACQQSQLPAGLEYKRAICHENKYLKETLYVVETYAITIKIANEIIGVYVDTLR